MQPILKKVTLEPALAKKYISKTPISVNILEKVVVDQLTAALERHSFNDNFQSGLRNSTQLKLLFWGFLMMY